MCIEYHCRYIKGPLHSRRLSGSRNTVCEPLETEEPQSRRERLRRRSFVCWTFFCVVSHSMLGLFLLYRFVLTVVFCVLCGIVGCRCSLGVADFFKKVHMTPVPVSFLLFSWNREVFVYFFS